MWEWNYVNLSPYAMMPCTIMIIVGIIMMIIMMNIEIYYWKDNAICDDEGILRNLISRCSLRDDVLIIYEMFNKIITCIVAE